MELNKIVQTGNRLYGPNLLRPRACTGLIYYAHALVRA